ALHRFSAVPLLAGIVRTEPATIDARGTSHIAHRDLPRLDTLIRARCARRQIAARHLCRATALRTNRSDTLETISARRPALLQEMRLAADVRFALREPSAPARDPKHQREHPQKRSLPPVPIRLHVPSPPLFPLPRCPARTHPARRSSTPR